MAIDRLIEDLNIIAGLGTNPNTDNNLTAEELKAMFDKASLIIQAYINGTLVPAVNENANAVSGKLDAAGGTMTGSLNMGGNQITGLPDPEKDSDAVNKAYMLERILSITGFSGEHKDLAGRDTAGQHPMSAITGLVTALGDKAPYVHDHDGRYYTEDEVNKLLEGYAASGHKHSASDVGALAASGGTVNGALTLNGNLVFIEGVNYGTTAQRPAPGIKGRVYLRKAGS